jgi:hypothetical protein
MITSKDPPRLFESEEVPVELRSWLDQAHHDTSSPVEIERIIRTVERLASTAAGAGSGITTARQAGSAGGAPVSRMGLQSLSAKLAVVGISAAGAGLVFSLLAERHEGWFSSGNEPSQDDTSASVSSAAVEELSVARASSSQAVPNPAEPPEARAQEQPHAAAVSEVEPTRPRPTHRSGPVPAATASSEPVPSDAAATDGASATSDQEFRLLRAARRALSTEPARALGLADEHARRFPSGMLGQEREAIAIEALTRLGRASEARSRAKNFLGRFPRSPYRARVEKALTCARAGAGR